MYQRLETLFHALISDSIIEVEFLEFLHHNPELFLLFGFHHAASNVVCHLAFPSKRVGLRLARRKYNNPEVLEQLGQLILYVEEDIDSLLVRV